MKQFIEDVLHQPIQIEIYKEQSKIPLIYWAYYNLFRMSVNGHRCMVAEPKEKINLTDLRKQQRVLERIIGEPCVFYFKELQSYPRDKMLEEGISFIWEGHQIYMPFLGILLKQNETRMLKYCTQISFLTQKLLLLALYEEWRAVTVTMAAERLEVTKMSITRCYDEIESLELPVLTKRGRTRLLSVDMGKKEMWNIIQPYMRSPLLQEFYLEKEIPKGLLRSGDSALCAYSMLEDVRYPTYAIAKKQVAELRAKYKVLLGREEEPTCVIQELGYMIDYKGKGLIDPLTVCLLLEKEKGDPRVEQAMEEMLREYVW
ncbi:MAG: hypothetical protein UHS49_04100 [Faecalimonas sp.]|nr:hypothetical protein [Faecalimonas sp.]